MKNYLYLIVCGILLSTSACQDVIDLDVPAGKTRLVVEGLLTDQGAMQTVKLTYTAPYFSNQDVPKVEGAQVSISDNTGEIMQLEETSKGVYQKQFAGIAGRKYQLSIILSNNKEYRSIEETLKAAPPIDSIYYEYVEKSLFNEDEGYYVSIKASDPPGKNDYYRWRYFVNSQMQSEPQDLFFATDRIIDGNYDITVGFSNDALLPGDSAKVEQMAISESAYNFLNLLYLQTANVGSQFDTPPAPIKGNVINPSDNVDYALGFFTVAGVATAEIVIEGGNGG